MQKVDIAELRRLHEAATKGEWQVNGSHIYGPDPERVLIAQTLDWPANSRDFIVAAHNALPALLDELEAARLEMRWQASVIAECKEEVRELKADYQRLEEIRRDLMERCERMRSIDGLPLDEIAARQITRDRHMKLIGAAEELERISANWYREMVAWTATDFEQQAATLRQEAEGK